MLNRSHLNWKWFSYYQWVITTVDDFYQFVERTHTSIFNQDFKPLFLISFIEHELFVPRLEKKKIDGVYAQATPQV